MHLIRDVFLVACISVFLKKETAKRTLKINVFFVSKIAIGCNSTVRVGICRKSLRIMTDFASKNNLDFKDCSEESNCSFKLNRNLLKKIQQLKHIYSKLKQSARIMQTISIVC